MAGSDGDTSAEDLERQEQEKKFEYIEREKELTYKIRKELEGTIMIFKLKDIPVYKPGETEYERSVATANLLYRFSRPDCVVQPQSPMQVQEVVKAIKRIKTVKIPLTIKNGGHSYAGFSTARNGILLDLVQMNHTILDMNLKTITLGGGALWGHAYKELVNGRHDKWVINGGRCPTVGVSGFTLGGGLGPFTRSFGMGCDCLKEATIVTAEGDLVTVDDEHQVDSNKGKLFWALRGGGGGNFGILVEMKLKVQELQDPFGNVVAGRFTWSPLQENKFLDTMVQFYGAPWSDCMTIDSSWICDLEDKSDIPRVRFLIYYNGSKKQYDTEIESHLEESPIIGPLKQRALEEPSTRFFHETLVEQWSEETLRSFPTSKLYSIYTSFVFDFEKRKEDEDSEEAKKSRQEKIGSVTQAIHTAMKRFRGEFSGERGLLQVTWIHSGGKAKETKPSDTAFFWRGCDYHVYIMIQWKDKWLEKDMRATLEDIKKDLRRFSMREKGAFVNFPDGALPKNDYGEAYFGDNYAGLQNIKKTWDPNKFFNWAQGVRLPNEQDNDEAVSEEYFTDRIAKDEWLIGNNRPEFSHVVVELIHRIAKMNDPTVKSVIQELRER
ncbi:hypothetical protein BDV25DRAFT_137022 [Aspergillus avenaceus]|uniref:FAD-binding PCMH-type domain-containing protein n=1 Tax=Aspergillus avenaceus TaxID=36643 RepID=A0A5N6U3V9_ASPAV|nr:hypothetical protein BDV25DRAFT_137022 [Aspergillus avenaceus]